jgi:hypothetical protein
MDGNFLLNILCQTHIQQTNLEIPPFSFTVDFNPDLLDKEKYQSVSKNPEELKKFVKECMDMFLEKNPGIPKGSVHLRPDVWVKFALKTIAIGYKNKQTKITFPNGCCSLGIECPINMFYCVVLEKIMLN